MTRSHLGDPDAFNHSQDPQGCAFIDGWMAHAEGVFLREAPHGRTRSWWQRGWRARRAARCTTARSCQERESDHVDDLSHSVAQIDAAEVGDDEQQQAPAERQLLPTDEDTHKFDTVGKIAATV